LTNKPPHIVITGPAAGAVLHPYTAVILAGFADDAEVGLLTEGSLTWTSDRLGVLGHGAQLVLPGSTLPTGVNTIRLEATDSAGRAAAAEVQLFVGFRALAPMVAR
jgi:hypothetical protein